MENLRALPVARWPDLVEHPAAQEHAPELAELLLENSARHLEDDPRLAAAFAALAGLVLTRGPAHDERPAGPGYARVLAQLAQAGHLAATAPGEPA